MGRNIMRNNPKKKKHKVLKFKKGGAQKLQGKKSKKQALFAKNLLIGRDQNE